MPALPESFILTVHLPSRGTREVSVALQGSEVDTVALADPDTTRSCDPVEAFALDVDEQQVAREWASDAVLDLESGEPLHRVQESFVRRSEVCNLSRHPFTSR
jgi:hypothetical protein